MVRRRICSIAARVIATGALVGALGVGCGTDEDATSAGTTGPALTIEEWTAEVDAICGDAREEVLDVAPPDSPDQYLPWLDVQLGILEEQADRVEALGTPATNQDDVAAFIANYRASVELLQEALDFQEQGATPLAEDRMAELVETFTANQEENQDLQERLGVEGCQTNPAMLQRPELDPTTTLAE